MREKVLIFFLFVCLQSGYAQPINELLSNNSNKHAHFEVLADKGYSIQQVATDTSLHFKEVDSFNLEVSTKYWIKYRLHNPSDYDENCVLHFNPAISNTSYIYDSNSQKYRTDFFGFDVADRYKYGLPTTIFTIRRNETKVNYILCNATTIKKYVKQYPPILSLYLEENLIEKSALPHYAWLITLFMLMFFFLYNAYLYIVFKDKTYLYYLLLQLGATIYITASTHLFHYLIETPFFAPFKTSNGSLYFFSKDIFANRIGSIIVISSFVQLTRHYLATQIKAPVVDKRLKRLLWLYLFIEVAFLIGFLTHATLPTQYSLIENSILLLVITYIYYATWYCYKHDYKPAFYLFIANLVPLSIIVILVTSLMVTRFFVGYVQILPSIAVVSQSITFAIALHYRLKSLKNSLFEQQEEALILKQQIENLVQRQETIALENEIIADKIEIEKSKNEVLLQKLEVNHREMASNTMYMYQKNSLLSYLKEQMKELNKILPDTAKQTTRNIDATLQNHQFVAADWDKFKLHFEKVHPSFFEDLKNKYPDLTKSETRLCAYLHLNMSTKEIAALLNIDPASVRRAKTRLNKKLNIRVAEIDE